MNIYNGFISKTNWTLVVMVVIAVGNALVPFMPTDVAATTITVLGVLAGLFHVTGVEKAAIASADATAATAVGAIPTPVSGQ